MMELVYNAKTKRTTYREAKPEPEIEMPETLPTLEERIIEIEKATGSGGQSGEKGFAKRIDSLENRIAKLEGS